MKVVKEKYDKGRDKSKNEIDRKEVMECRAKGDLVRKTENHLHLKRKGRKR